MPLPTQVASSTILAAALSDLFPAIKLLNFQATESCFVSDFILPFPFEKEMLPLLEDRMRGWVKKDLPFQQLEMVPSNAAQFLEHHGNSFEASKIRAETGFVQLIRLDHFAGRSPGISLESTGELKFFKLALFQTHDNWIRLIGTAALSKEELKARAAQCKNLPCHLDLIEKHRLLKPCPSGWLWLPRGEKLKKNIIEKAAQEFPGVDWITTPALDDPSLLACHASYGRPSWEIVKLSLSPTGYELFNTPIGISDRLFFAADEDRVISFLQNIAKFLTIFSFDIEVVIIGKISKLLREGLKKVGLKTASERGEQSSIEFRLRDALGRPWAGPRMWHVEKKDIVVISLFYSLERFVALLLERPVLERPDFVKQMDRQFESQ